MPRYKSVSFAGAPHPISLKFGDDDPSFEAVNRLSSAEVRDAIRCETYDELLAAAARAGTSPHHFIRTRVEGSLGRMAQPRPYAGWPSGTLASAETARAWVRESGAQTVIDPFAGHAEYATAAAQIAGVHALYCEVSPVFRFIAESRTQALIRTDGARETIASELVAFASEFERASRGASPDPTLVATRRGRFADEESQAARSAADDTSDDVRKAIDFLERLRTAIDDLPPLTANLAAAAVVEALPRATRDLSRSRFIRDYRAELEIAAAFVRSEARPHSAVVRVADDARELTTLEPLGVDCVLTNPPSLNFASYVPPVPLWFLGMRRPRPRKSRIAEDAVEELRRRVGSDGRRAVTRISGDVAKLRRQNDRMERVVANYFADMAEALAAITSQMSPRSSFAFEVGASKVAGVDIDTVGHLEAVLAAFGFGSARDVGQFRVMAR